MCRNHIAYLSIFKRVKSFKDLETSSRNQLSPDAAMAFSWLGGRNGNFTEFP
jgi:hypothetical protein